VQPILVHPGAYVSSGGTSEKIAIVAGIVDASNAGGIHGVEGESEDILCVVVPADEFIRRARKSEIADLKTLVAAYWFADNRERLRHQGL
jgi:ADP-ribose pyrophosphatase